MGGVEEVFQISWLLINRMKRKTAENDEKDTGKKKKISKHLEELGIGGVWDGSTSPNLVPTKPDFPSRVYYVIFVSIVFIYTNLD